MDPVESLLKVQEGDVDGLRTSGVRVEDGVEDERVALGSFPFDKSVLRLWNKLKISSPGVKPERAEKGEAAKKEGLKSDSSISLRNVSSFADLVNRNHVDDFPLLWKLASAQKNGVEESQ